MRPVFWLQSAVCSLVGGERCWCREPECILAGGRGRCVWAGSVSSTRGLEVSPCLWAHWWPARQPLALPAWYLPPVSPNPGLSSLIMSGPSVSHLTGCKVSSCQPPTQSQCQSPTDSLLVSKKTELQQSWPSVDAPSPSTTKIKRDKNSVHWLTYIT